MESLITLQKIDGLTLEHMARQYSFTLASNHFHPEFEIYYLFKGERSYFIEEHTYPVKQGTLVFIAANQIHKTADFPTSSKYIPPHERLLILLEPKYYNNFSDMAESMNLKNFFVEFSGVLTLTYQEQNEIETLLLKISNEMVQKQDGSSFLIKSKMTELLLFIMRKFKSLYIGKSTVTNTTPLSSSDQIISGITSYISENLTSECSLEKIAEHFSFSKYYLCKLFKSSTGLTINEYLNMKKIQKAQFYLKTTNLSITEISELSGYESLTHFERVFRKYISQTPLKYRKSHKG